MNSFELEEISEAEISRASEILSKLSPGYLPFNIFIEVARLTVTTTIEMVGLRRDSRGGAEVLLTRREADDPIWPNMLHVPGSVLRATDKEGDYANAFNRIFEHELGGIKTVEPPVFVKNSFHQVRRGRELALIHYVELAGEPPIGTFYSVNSLPKDTVDHQVGFIQEVSRLFLQNKQ